MDYKMPNLNKIGGQNKIEVPPIIIELEGKENPINIIIAKKVIQKMIEISPWYRWSLKNPKKKFLSPKKIHQLACDFMQKGILHLEPAYLELTMKNGCISFNVSYWLNRGDSGYPRPLGDIQYLERLMKETATEVREIAREIRYTAREEATPEETRQFVEQSAIEAWVPSKIF
jgi:hypothetical protein